MIRICFFHVKAHAIFDSKSEAPIGGTLVQMHVLAKELALSAKYQVSFITGDFGQKDIEEYGSIKVYKSIKLKRDFWHFFIAPFKIWKTLKKVNADVYITSSAGAEIGIVALFCKIYGKKNIYRTAHEIDCSGEYIRKNGINGKMFRYGIENADAIVTQSLDHKKLLKTSCKLDSVVIKNSFEISSSKESEKGKVILWVSRCEEWKNPLIFLKLAEKLPQFNFVMICPKQKMQETFFNLVEKKSETIKNLKFIEFIPFEKIQQYFDRANVFVGTSDFEGFPNTYMQACLGETPIVSYKVNPDNFITKNQLGYVSNGTFSLMTEQVAKLMEDENDWKKKSINARAYIKREHDIKSNVFLWENIFDKLLAN